MATVSVKGLSRFLSAGRMTDRDVTPLSVSLLLYPSTYRSVQSAERDYEYLSVGGNHVRRRAAISRQSSASFVARRRTLWRLITVAMAAAAETGTTVINICRAGLT